MVYNTMKDLFKAICDAIRSKDGTTDSIPHQDIPERIMEIDSTTGVILPTIPPEKKGSESDLAEGKQLINEDGSIITGSLTTVNSDIQKVFDKTNRNVSSYYEKNEDDISNSSITLYDSVEEDILLRKNSKLHLKTKASIYGNARPEDVMKNVTFTSENGIKIVGTSESSSIAVIKPLTITENGTYTATDGVSGYSPIVVDVTHSAPAPAPVIEPLTITKNGTYTAPAGIDGYSPVTVNISAVIQPASDIEASNLSELHYWTKVSIYGDIQETEITDVILSNYGSLGTGNAWDKVDYADEIRNIDGTLSLVNPTTITLSGENEQTIVGKYIYSYLKGKFYRLPSQPLKHNSGLYSADITASSAFELTVSSAGTSSIIISKDIDAYPENGEQNGFVYEYQGILGG